MNHQEHIAKMEKDVKLQGLLHEEVRSAHRALSATACLAFVDTIIRSYIHCTILQAFVHGYPLQRQRSSAPFVTNITFGAPQIDDAEMIRDARATIGSLLTSYHDDLLHVGRQPAASSRESLGALQGLRARA
jgi:hypothetical protein